MRFLSIILGVVRRRNLMASLSKCVFLYIYTCIFLRWRACEARWMMSLQTEIYRPQSKLLIGNKKFFPVLNFKVGRILLLWCIMIDLCIVRLVTGYLSPDSDNFLATTQAYTTIKVFMLITSCQEADTKYLTPYHCWQLSRWHESLPD